MPSTFPVILILGAGPNISQGVACVFASKGYKVALAARLVTDGNSADNQLYIKNNFINSNDIINAFATTKKILNVPSIIVYNGKSRHQRLLAECLLRVRSRCFYALSS
jgi:NADP-dependent 3-hydroxy acid dehydrogenase YdfG